MPSTGNIHWMLEPFSSSKIIQSIGKYIQTKQQVMCCPFCPDELAKNQHSVLSPLIPGAVGGDGGGTRDGCTFPKAGMLQ